MLWEHAKITIFLASLWKIIIILGGPHNKSGWQYSRINTVHLFADYLTLLHTHIADTELQALECHTCYLYTASALGSQLHRQVVCSNSLTCLEGGKQEKKQEIRMIEASY